MTCYGRMYNRLCNSLHVIAESICRLSLGCVSAKEKGECADGEDWLCAFRHTIITHRP